MNSLSALFSVRIGTNKVDVSKKEQIEALWKKLEGKEPEILVNTAGIYPVFWMCQHMIRSRLKKGGVIINMSSIEVVMPLKEELSHYDISKAGVMVLSRTLASEYGKHGFRINVLVPGGIWTSGTKNLAKEATKFKLNIIKSGIELI